jgi:hypothetical protein
VLLSNFDSSTRFAAIWLSHSDQAHVLASLLLTYAQIAERVSEETDFRTIFKVEATEAASKIATGKQVLDAWSEVYLQVRERIESIGRDPRCYSIQIYQGTAI